MYLPIDVSHNPQVDSVTQGTSFIIKQMKSLQINLQIRNYLIVRKIMKL